MNLPVGASLTIDGEPTLIAGAARTLRLDIHNRSGRPILLPPRPLPPGAGNHHLALHFPNATLSPGSPDGLIAQDGWSMAVGETVEGDNRWDSLFLVRADGGVLDSDEQLTVLLHGVTTRLGGTARHARVVLTYDLSAEGEATPLRGSRALRLYVVPWAESSAALHLHAGVFAGTEIVNLGEVENRVEIRITCTAVDGAVRLIGGVTQLELAWDVGPADTHWWALCTGAEAEAVDIETAWDAGNTDQVDDSLDGTVWLTETGAVWSATLNEDRVLEHGDALSIVLSRLMTSHPTGPANLYLRVLGVDGGASGSFLLKLRKQSFAWSNDGGLTLVTGDTDTPLTVRTMDGDLALALSRHSQGHAVTVHRADGTIGVRLDASGRSTLGDINLDGQLSVRGAAPLQVLAVEADSGEVDTGRAFADWMVVLCATSSGAVKLAPGAAGNWIVRYQRNQIEQAFGAHPSWTAQLLFIRRELAS